MIALKAPAQQAWRHARRDLVAPNGQQAPVFAPTTLLHLGASPIFALMAVVTAIHASGIQGTVCGVLPEASPLTGMTAMYVLMSIFHFPPWLKLIGRKSTKLWRRNG